MKLDITFPVPSIVITFNPNEDPEHSPLLFNVVTVYPPPSSYDVDSSQLTYCGFR